MEREGASEEQSMREEWRNIHHKAIFDAFNEALQLEYKPNRNEGVAFALEKARIRVTEWSRLFGGALACSELLEEYGIVGPLENEKHQMLREERLGLILQSDVSLSLCLIY